MTVNANIIIRLSLLVFCLVALPSPTAAWVSDVETSAVSEIKTGTLDLKLSATTTALSLTPETGSNDQTTIAAAAATGSIPLRYSLRIGPPSSDSGLCEQLNLSVSLEGALLYSGPLLELVIPAIDSFGDLTFETELAGDGAEVGDECAADIAFEAWQTNFPAFGQGGFTDTESLRLQITVTEPPPTPTNLLINEIYANEKPPADAPFDTEWVELFNAGSAAVDLENWSLGEFAGESGNETLHRIGAAHTCTANEKIGFARPYGGASTILPPGEYVLVEFCAQNRLNNNGDLLKLYDSTDALIDERTFPRLRKGGAYGYLSASSTWQLVEPTPGSENIAAEAAGMSDPDLLNLSLTKISGSGTGTAATTAAFKLPAGSSTEPDTTTEPMPSGESGEDVNGGEDDAVSQPAAEVPPTGETEEPAELKPAAVTESDPEASPEPEAGTSDADSEVVTDPPPIVEPETDPVVEPAPDPIIEPEPEPAEVITESPEPVTP